METSASPYRYKRVEQLMEQSGKISVEKAVSILRDPNGLNDREIGLGNEKTINQFVAHHGIIFQPEKKLVWVSSPPWQLGKFVCYDLNKVFGMRMTRNVEIYEPSMTIAADSSLLKPKVRNFLKALPYRLPFSSRENLNPDSVISWNPNDYYMYMLAGDYYFDRKDFHRAKNFYEQGLTKEIATAEEREYLLKRMRASKDKIE
jgi:isopenicillin-N N-acyltransferase like protein